MKVTEGQGFFLLPVENYRGDLKISDSEGREMIILPDKEFDRQTGSSMEELNEKYGERMVKKLGEEIRKKHEQLTQNYRIIAVLFNRPENEKEFYEKVNVSWISKVKREDIGKDGNISELAKIRIVLLKYGSKQKSTSSLYLSIRVDPKYRIASEPTFNDLTSNNPVEKIDILSDERHKVYRFTEKKDAEVLETTIHVGKPKDIKNWLTVGFLSAIIPPGFIIGMFFGFREMPPFSFEVLGGIVAFLIGQRAFIFQDSYLMKNWNRVIIGSAIWVASLMLCLIFLSNFISPVGS